MVANKVPASFVEPKGECAAEMDGRAMAAMGTWGPLTSACLGTLGISMSALH